MKKKKVTFDFDGILHSSVVKGTLHPVSFYEVDRWKPRYDMHDNLIGEAEDHDVYIVTSRMSHNEAEIMEFVLKYDLPISGIICCDDEPKAPVLIRMGSIRHYDEDAGLAEPLRKANIEFILSKPPYEGQDLDNEDGSIKYY